MDPEQRQRAEQTLHRYEILNRQLRRLQILVLVTVAVGMIGVPIVHVAVNWFVHIRPELVLLREGVPVRATVTAVTRCLGFISRIEYGFTAAHGESVRKKQFVATAESSVFKIGDSLWVLSLPDRPKHAQLYGLYHQFAELTMGD